MLLTIHLKCGEARSPGHRRAHILGCMMQAVTKAMAGALNVPAEVIKTGAVIAVPCNDNQ